MANLQNFSGWQLDARVTPSGDGHHLLLSRFAPAERRPEHQVRFSGTFTVEELRLLRDTLNRTLAD